jgi:selina-4(15),7(11)-diene synthase
VTATTLKLHRPGPLDIHPDADLLDAQGARWLHHHRLGNDHAHREFLARSGFGHCVAPLYPHAGTAILQTVTDLMYWSFALDDIRDAPGHDARAAAHMGRLQRTIEAPDAALLGDDLLSTALHDVITRMTCQIPPAQMRRFTEGMRTYFLGAAWELAARTTSEPPGLNETTGIRLYSVGAQPFVALIEAVNGYRLDHDELTAPAVQAMTEMTWLISAWDNDICSWSKESRGAAADNSFVTALARLHHQTTAQALAQAANLRNQVMARFLDLSDEITPPHPSACVATSATSPSGSAATSNSSSPTPATSTMTRLCSSPLPPTASPTRPRPLSPLSPGGGTPLLHARSPRRNILCERLPGLHLALLRGRGQRVPPAVTWQPRTQTSAFPVPWRRSTPQRRTDYEG